MKEIKFDGGISRLCNVAKYDIPYEKYSDLFDYDRDKDKIKAIANKWIREWEDMDVIISYFLHMPTTQPTIEFICEKINKELERLLPLNTKSGKIIRFNAMYKKNEVIIFPEYEDSVKIITMIKATENDLQSIS